MKNDSIGELVFVLFISLILCGLSFGIGFATGRDDTRKQAIKAGVAEWTINSQTGECQFVFKTQAK